MSTLDVISGHLSEIKIALKNGQFNENSVSELSNVMSKISSLICIMANDLEKPCSIMAQKWDEIELEL